MNHVMLDLETMGKQKNASIISIGACYFEPSTGEIGKTFHEEVRLGTGGEIDASTVIWWMKQDDEARSKFYDNEKAQHIVDALHKFSEFLEKDVQVWGNGIAFDNVVLESAYEQFFLPIPWDFWNHRDVRTMVELGRAIGFDPKQDLVFEGVKHDALADAIHQAKYVSMIWQKLTKRQD